MADTVPVKKSCMTSFMTLFQKTKVIVIDEEKKAIQSALDRIAVDVPKQASCYGNVSDVPVAAVPVAAVPAAAPVADSDPAATQGAVDALVKDVSEIAAAVVASQKKKPTYRFCLYCSSHPQPLPSEKSATQVSQTSSLTVRVAEAAP